MLSRIVAAIAAPHCVCCRNWSFRELCAPCRNASLIRAQTPGGYPVLALAHYDEPAGATLRALKYEEETVLACRLGRALGILTPAPWSHHRFVPVPLHPERLVERGYNQAALLAREAADQAGARAATHLVERIVATGAQARLSLSQRQKNTEGAFRARAQKRTERLILVDDVVTTGSTIDACASALELAGHQVEGVLAGAIAGSLSRAEPEDRKGISALVALGGSRFRDTKMPT